MIATTETVGVRLARRPARRRRRACVRRARRTDPAALWRHPRDAGNRARPDAGRARRGVCRRRIQPDHQSGRGVRCHRRPRSHESRLGDRRGLRLIDRGARDHRRHPTRLGAPPRARQCLPGARSGVDVHGHLEVGRASDQPRRARRLPASRAQRCHERSARACSAVDRRRRVRRARRRVRPAIEPVLRPDPQRSAPDPARSWPRREFALGLAARDRGRRRRGCRVRCLRRGSRAGRAARLPGGDDDERAGHSGGAPSPVAGRVRRRWATRSQTGHWPTPTTSSTSAARPGRRPP